MKVSKSEIFDYNVLSFDLNKLDGISSGLKDSDIKIIHRIFYKDYRLAFFGDFIDQGTAQNIADDLNKFKKKFVIYKSKEYMQCNAYQTIFLFIKKNICKNQTLDHILCNIIPAIYVKIKNLGYKTS